MHHMYAYIYTYFHVNAFMFMHAMKDVVEHVPLHWKNGVVETRGSRWSGASLTIDSLVTEGANKRIIDGEEVTDIRAYYDVLREKGEIRDISSYYTNNEEEISADEL